MPESNSPDISLNLLDSAVVSSGAQGFRRSAITTTYLSARSLLVLVFLMVIFALACRPIVDPDFWWHLKTGQFLVETRSIPHADMFSTVFAGKEWITHEWLSEAFLFSIYRVAGFGGLIITFALLITLGFALVYRRSARRSGHVYVTGGAVLLGAMAAGPTWNVRPQIFSFLFAGLFFWLLEEFQFRRRKYSIWWLVPLMGLWVNMHAGFAVGIAVIAVVIVGTILDSLFGRESRDDLWSRVKLLTMVLVGCVGVIALNPSGTRIYAYPFETLTSPAMMKFIEEWRSPNFHQAMFQPLAIFIVVLVAALALSRKRISAVQLLLMVGTAWAMLRSARNVPFFVLASTPLLAEHSWAWLTSQKWGQWLKKPEPETSGDRIKLALNILLLLVAPATLVAVRTQSVLAEQSSVESEKFPREAVDFMRAKNLPQPLYNEYHWGGYLIWNLYPDYRVFIDGRADVYGDAFFEEFMSTQGGEPHWKENLNKHGVRTVLITPNSALASLLREDSAWDNVFEDQQAVIFTKKAETK
jgi:hypothetical protein